MPKKIFLSAFLGNLFEHYDTALFALLSPLFATLFFTNADPLTALIMTYAIIPLGMIAKPFGSIVFGMIANRFGRGRALFISLLGTAAVSVAIAFCPTFETVGVLAPVLLSLGRLLQSFFTAGEVIGGVVFLIEHSPKNRHDLISSLYDSSTIGGILLASTAVSLLYFFNIVETHWRVLYIFGSLTAFFGLLMRRKMSSLELMPNVEPKKSAFLSHLKFLWSRRRVLVVVAFAAGFGYATYSVALVMTNGFLPMVANVTKAEVMGLNTLLLIVDFAALPLFGWLASRISRYRLMMTAALFAAITGIPLFSLLDGAGMMTVIIVRTCLVLVGVCFFATFHSWSQSLLPVAERYAVISFAYAIGTQILGGPTSAVSLWLYQQTGMVSSAAWYWAFLGLGCAFLIAKTRTQPIERPVVNEMI